MPGLFHGCWGAKLRSSGLWNKHSYSTVPSFLAIDKKMWMYSYDVLDLWRHVKKGMPSDGRAEQQKQLETRPRQVSQRMDHSPPLCTPQAGLGQLGTLDAYLENDVAAESILPSADQRWPQDTMA